MATSPLSPHGSSTATSPVTRKLSGSSLIARRSFSSSSYTYQETPFNLANNCEVAGCHKSFYIFGRHHCRVCGLSVCDNHFLENIVLTSPVLNIPMTYSKVCTPCFSKYKHDEALKNNMASKIQIQWRMYRYTRVKLFEHTDTNDLSFEQNISFISSLLNVEIEATPEPHITLPSDSIDNSHNNTANSFEPYVHHQNSNGDETNEEGRLTNSNRIPFSPHASTQSHSSFHDTNSNYIDQAEDEQIDKPDLTEVDIHTDSGSDEQCRSKEDVTEISDSAGLSMEIAQETVEATPTASSCLICGLDWFKMSDFGVSAAAQ